MADIKWKTVVEINGNTVSEMAVDIPDAWVNKVLAYFGGYDTEVVNPDYDPEVEGSERMITNPESKVDFFNRGVLRDNKKRWKKYNSIGVGKDAMAQEESVFEDNVVDG